jgi:hypothetical protein
MLRSAFRTLGQREQHPWTTPRGGGQRAGTRLVQAVLAPLATLSGTLIVSLAFGAAPALAQCPTFEVVAGTASSNQEGNPECNLSNELGPVLRTHKTHVVYWQPAGFEFQAGYKELLEQYLRDVAADSGRVTNPYAVATQYTSSAGEAIQYKQSYAGAFLDTERFPTVREAGCELESRKPGEVPVPTVCLTEEQEEKQLEKFLNGKGAEAPREFENVYFLVLPRGVETCFNPVAGVAPNCGPYGQGTAKNAKGETINRFFCAFHSIFTGTTVWANMPDGADAKCNLNEEQLPNGNPADALINTLSHEQIEMITDPNTTVKEQAWYDFSNKEEIGDQCNNLFAELPGPPSEPLGNSVKGRYDAIINHHPYAMQREWTNASNGCAMTLGTVAPSASFTVPATARALNNVEVNASGSRSNDAGGYIIRLNWEFGDTSTATVTGDTPAGTVPVAVNAATPTETHKYATAGTRTVKLKVRDDAGLEAEASKEIKIERRPTKLTVDAPAQVSNGASATLKGTLSDVETSAGVGGKTVKFTLGSGTSAQECEGVTNASGQAECTITTVHQPAGATSASIEDRFEGDNTYEPAKGSGTATLQFYTGRAFALSTRFFGLPFVFSDTGAISTSESSTTTRALASAFVPGLPFFAFNGSLLETSVITGAGRSVAEASQTSLSVRLPFFPAIAAKTVDATSSSTCSGSVGTTSLASLQVGGLSLPVSPPPNTVVLPGPFLRVVLNEQTPVAGASHGLIVNAVHIEVPGVIDIIVSSAESDIHNCP